MLQFTVMCLLTYLRAGWTYIINIILKINDMGLLAEAYMTKGDIHQGEEEAVKVTFTILVTKYLELCSCRSADLWHCWRKFFFFDKPFHVRIISSSLFSTLIPPTANKEFKAQLDLFDFQWYNEALRIATEQFGEKDEQCGVIYYNTGFHHEKRGKLQEAYEIYKGSYLIYKEVLWICQLLYQKLINVFSFCFDFPFFWLPDSMDLLICYKSH